MKKPLITLYTPGNRPEFIEKADKYNPDAIIIDLEDSVPVQLKENTRIEIAKILPYLKIQCLVRINNEHDFIEDDLNAIVSEHIYGIVLPMAETVESVQKVDKIITDLESRQSIKQNTVKLLLLIETARGVFRCYDLISAADRVESVIFGSAEDADLQRDLRCSWSVEGTELMYARSKTLLEARAAGLNYVLDGAFSDIKNADALRQDSILSKRLGYDGRTLIHPGQIDVARKAYMPKDEEIVYYKKLIEHFDSAIESGVAATMYEGKLIDYAMYKKAKALIELYTN